MTTISSNSSTTLPPSSTTITSSSGASSLPSSSSPPVSSSSPPPSSSSSSTTDVSSSTVLPTQTPTDPPPSSSPLPSPPSSPPPSSPPPSSPPSSPPPSSSPPSSDPSNSPPSSPPPSSELSTPLPSSPSRINVDDQPSTPPMPSSTSDALTTLTAPSTTVMQSTSVGMSDGQLFTTVVQVTSVRPPGSIVSGPPGRGNSGARTGAIVGGVVGGIAALLLLILALLLRVRRRTRQRQKAAFDGNFDPARFSGSTRMSLENDGNGPEQDMDDGMSGRLSGLVTPFVHVYDPAEMGERGGRHDAYQTASYNDPYPSSGSGSAPHSHSPTHSDAGTGSTAGAYHGVQPRDPQYIQQDPHIQFNPGLSSGLGLLPDPHASNSNPGVAGRSTRERNAPSSRGGGEMGVVNTTPEDEETRAGTSSGVDKEAHRAYLANGPRMR